MAARRLGSRGWRIYFLQQWFNLSDPAVEEALDDSLAMRGFVGIDLGRESVPDETTVCLFRHLLETHDLGRRRRVGMSAASCGADDAEPCCPALRSGNASSFHLDRCWLPYLVQTDRFCACRRRRQINRAGN